MHVNLFIELFKNHCILPLRTLSFCKYLQIKRFFFFSFFLFLQISLVYFKICMAMIIGKVMSKVFNLVVSEVFDICICSSDLDLEMSIFILVHYDSDLPF
jgi:hypothetical protein